ncbi:SpoIID/LytB domain-containing protein [bacterium]|nr:SpoIID/LytB domain-containing protein [bacterium]
MTHKLLIVFIFLFFNILSGFALPLETNSLISVGISDNSFQRYYYVENTFYATKKLILSDKKNAKTIAEFEPNTPVTVKIKNNLFEISKDNIVVAQNVNPPIVLSTEKGGVLGITNLKRAGQPALYRGTIELVKPSCKENMFLVNNVLKLESYLLGVVPNEMPVRFGLEALKVQAISARNYALRPREKKYHEFDVCDSVSCQVYFGVNTEKPLATQAVLETRGIVGLHEDELIVALYSSTAGGYTESYDNAFLPKEENKFKYLQGVPDNKKEKSLEKEEDALEFYKSEPKTYDNDSPYFRWTREWTREELEKVLKEGLPASFKTGYSHPELKKTEDFGNLKEIKVIKRGKSGKIVSLEIITDKEKFIVEKELVIRRLFKNNGKALPSANVVFEHEFEKDKLLKIKAYGGGYGHGVGMSQYGAGSMARDGKTFDEIFQHYYSDTKIVLLPFELSNTPEKNTAVYDFYLTKKQAKIVVDNKKNYSELKVVINGKEFNLKAEPSLNKKYEVDISKYVKIGDNKVYFFYPLEDNREKSLKVYIELYGTGNGKHNDK